MANERDRIILDPTNGNLQSDLVTTRVDGQLELGLIEHENESPEGDAIKSYRYITDLLLSTPDSQLRIPQLIAEKKLILEDRSLTIDHESKRVSYRKTIPPANGGTNKPRPTFYPQTDRSIVFARLKLKGKFGPLSAEEARELQRHLDNLIANSKDTMTGRRLKNENLDAFVTHSDGRRKAAGFLTEDDEDYRSERDTESRKELRPKRKRSGTSTPAVAPAARHVDNNLGIAVDFQVDFEEHKRRSERERLEAEIEMAKWDAEFAEAIRTSAPVLPPQLVPHPAPEPIPDILPTGYEAPPPGPLRPVRRI